MISAKGAERLAFAGVFLFIALISTWFGGGLIRRSQETHLVREVLFEWQRFGQGFNARGGGWPVFKGSNHVAYMQELVKRMGRLGLISPQQMQRIGFTPRLKHLWRADEQLFLLLLPGRMVIFGLSAQTYAYIDGQVDGVNDPARGKFTGRPAVDENRMIGYWQL